MKASLIISQEYSANQPSVFAMIQGKYYGCQIYPAFRKFPETPEYWKNTTSSDSDRGFKVSDIEYSETELNRIEILQNVISSCSRMLVETPSTWIPQTWRVRRGAAYGSYKIKSDELMSAYKKVSEANAPFEKVIYIASEELRMLLLKK